MKKKVKLFVTISSLCLALATLCFGVFSATNITYTVGGSISYEVNDVFADVKTRVYASSFKDKSTLSTKVSTLAESGDVTDLTDTLYTYDFSTDGDSHSFDNTEGGTKEGIKIEYNTTNKRTYFVVVSIKNRADNTISANISGKGLSDGANTVFAKSNAIASLTSKEEEKRLVMAFMLDDITTGTNGAINFEYTISIDNGALAQTYATLQYLNNDDTYSINKEDKITTQVYTATITVDKSRGEEIDENNTIYFYNFKLSNIDLDLCSLAIIEFENVKLKEGVAEDNGGFYLTKRCCKSIQEVFEDENFEKNVTIIPPGDTSGVNINLTKDECAFSIMPINVSSFDLKITLESLGTPAGNVNITNKESNFETSQFESNLYDNIITSTSYDYTLTKSKVYNVLKLDINTTAEIEQMIDIEYTYDYTNGCVLLLSTEEYLNELLAKMEKTKDELTNEDWGNLVGAMVLLDYYLLPTGNSLESPTSDTFSYMNNRVTITGSSYYLIFYSQIEDDSTIITGSVDIKFCNIQDFKQELYTISSDGTYYEFTKLNDTEVTEYEVLSTYEGKPVKSIGDYAFSGTKVKKVKMPDSITKLGTRIFYNCSIESFIIPNNVNTLAKGVFSNAEFGTLIIPETVTTVEKYAFSDTGTSSFRSIGTIENLIVKCNYSAFQGDITNSQQDFTAYKITNMTVYVNQLWNWLIENKVIGYITGSLYVKAEYLETMKTTYADSYLVRDGLIKAMA